MSIKSVRIMELPLRIDIEEIQALAKNAKNVSAYEAYMKCIEILEETLDKFCKIEEN